MKKYQCILGLYEQPQQEQTNDHDAAQQARAIAAKGLEALIPVCPPRFCAVAAGVLIPRTYRPPRCNFLLVIRCEAAGLTFAR